jgi:DNA-directed RNA polymerase subunit beta'
MQKSLLKVNKTFGKNEIKNLIHWFLKNYGSLRTKLLVDKLKKIGFNYLTTAGLSLGIEDLRIPKSKKIIFENSEKSIYSYRRKHENGKINQINYAEKIAKIWNTNNEILRDEILHNFRQNNLLNPLYMMTLSGARGNISQIKQLVGMRGLMADSQGEILTLPIKNNFKEGLNIIEYFISCYGARKGIVDTALKTANSGYLTRRLIYVAQNQFIKQINCNTKLNNLILIKTNTKKKYISTQNKLLGRIINKDIFNSEKKIVISKGQDICNVRIVNNYLIFKFSFIISILLN